MGILEYYLSPFILLYIHHIFGKSISAVMNIEVLPVAHVLNVVLIFKLLDVIIDPSIGLL